MNSMFMCFIMVGINLDIILFWCFASVSWVFQALVFLIGSRLEFGEHGSTKRKTFIILLMTYCIHCISIEQ
jgi:hypothetical protein